MGKKEKLLVTSNFSFSQGVFYLYGEFSTIFIKFKIVICKVFQFGMVENLLLGKGLKTEILSGMGRKHCRKRRNAGCQHFLFFPQCFKRPFFRVFESQDCVVQGLNTVRICLLSSFSPFPTLFP